jgi:hypothetical protein
MGQVTARFPQEAITRAINNDPSWRLFNGYAADFHFD